MAVVSTLSTGSGPWLFGLSLAAIGAALCLVWAALALVVILQLTSVLKRIPRRFRTIEPELVWLLLLPCVNLIWYFIVLPKVSRSLKAYFNYTGDRGVGDCAEGLGWAYCICGVCALVPYLGYLAAMASVVVLILYLTRVHALKYRIPPDAEARLWQALLAYPPPPLPETALPPKTEDAGPDAGVSPLSEPLEPTAPLAAESSPAPYTQAHPPAP